MRLRAAAALLPGLAATLTGYLVCLNLRDRSEDRALAGEARAATLAVRALSSNTERAIWSGFAVVLTSDGNPETFARMMPIASPAVLAGGRLYRAEGDTLAMTAEFGSPKLSKEPRPRSSRTPSPTHPVFSTGSGSRDATCGSRSSRRSCTGPTGMS